ncbi:MAG: family transposase [Proteobacteria bacterium]|nr:family transposase [Pseudomonadota bacterium]
MKKRFTEEQIVGFLREAEAALPIAELCRKHAFSEASYYLWRSKFGGMSVSDAKRLKELELNWSWRIPGSSACTPNPCWRTRSRKRP